MQPQLQSGQHSCPIHDVTLHVLKFMQYVGDQAAGDSAASVVFDSSDTGPLLRPSCIISKERSNLQSEIAAQELRLQHSRPGDDMLNVEAARQLAARQTDLAGSRSLPASVHDQQQLSAAADLAHGPMSRLESSHTSAEELAILLRG